MVDSEKAFIPESTSPGGRNSGSSGFNENVVFLLTESSGNSDLRQPPAANYPNHPSSSRHYRWDERGKSQGSGCRRANLEVFVSEKVQLVNVSSKHHISSL